MKLDQDFKCENGNSVNGNGNNGNRDNRKRQMAKERLKQGKMQEGKLELLRIKWGTGEQKRYFAKIIDGKELKIEKKSNLVKW
jgi:hypothetical protein